jgi:diguanylate cyclase (GGDEF)-like protein/PAS domain S-box-containing protein
LRQNEAWANAVLTGSSDHAVGSLDARGIVCGWHSGVGRVLGFARDGVLGRPYSIFYPDGAITPDRLLDRLHEADRNGWSLDEGWRVGADGARFWGSVMIVPIGAEPAREPTYSLVIRDITEQRESSELRRLASASDHLTGIANRRTFFEAAALEFERRNRMPRPLSLILFDLDHFKRINDTHGHAAGDAVLRHFASLLTATFRQIDVVARVGGEEFAVLLPSTDLDAAQASANRLRQAFAEVSIEVDGLRIPCTVSGGVATVDDRTDDIEALMKHADRALYAAKGAGRNRIERQSDD